MRERILAPGHDRARSLGWFALAWLEHFAVHGPGDVEGTPLSELPLDDEFAGLIIDGYCVDERGRRLYDSEFLSRAKGRAKSEYAGFHVLFEGFGPCRFERWAEGGELYRDRDFTYEYQPGEPIGRQVVYPFIRCLATEEGQSGNTYDNVYFNLTHGPLSEGLPTNCAGLTRIFLPNGGEIVPSTASNAAKDGGKETFVVFDETHLYTRPELVRMYRTVRRNMAKRKDAEPWSLETSTMYLPGEDSVAEETHKLAQKIRDGKVKRPRLLFDHRQGPELDDSELGDEKKLTEALREAYGPFADVMDLRRIVDEVFDPRNPPGESRRYFLNQPTAAIDAFIAPHEWEACKDTTRALEPGDLITLGFDGGRQSGAKHGKPDATGVVATRVEDGFQFVLGHWEAEEGPGMEDWVPPVAEVDATIDDAFSTYEVAGFYADPPHWEANISAWEAKYANRLAANKKGQRISAKPGHPFCWWMGGRPGVTENAIRTYEDGIIGRQLSHSGQRAFTAHVLNARRRVKSSYLGLAKENTHSSRKIDLCVCAMLSWKARVDAVALGIGTKPKRRAPIALF